MCNRVIRYSIALMCLLSAGCAASRTAAPQATRPVQPDEAEAAACALVFDSPLRPDGPMPELARAPREPSAFVGYEDTISEFLYVRMEDRQGNDWQDGYERRAISEKVGVRYR